METSRWLPKAQQAAFCLLAFTIPLPFRFAAISSVVVAAISLPSLFRKITWQNFRSTPGLWLWPLFYLLHAISFSYSLDKYDSLFDLESKLSFVLLPLVLGTSHATGRKQFEQILLAFIAGISLTATLCLLNASVDFLQYGEKSRFFYHDLVTGFEANAVYMAWYVLTALSALLFCRWTHVFGRKGAWYWLLVALLSIFFVLLSSKTLLLFWVALVIPLFLYRRRTAGSISRSAVIIVLILLVGSTALIAFTDNPVRRRYDGMLKNDLGIAYLPSYRDTVPQLNNLTTRLFIWRVGMDNISKDQRWLFGAGNGSVHLLQNQRFDELGIGNIYDEQKPSPLRGVNLHNMYLQTWLMIGLPGLLILLFIVFFSLIACWRMLDREMFFLFHAAGVLFLAQEAALQTQAGIIFYTFFNCLFWQQYRRERSEYAIRVN